MVRSPRSYSEKGSSREWRCCGQGETPLNVLLYRCSLSGSMAAGETTLVWYQISVQGCSSQVFAFEMDSVTVVTYLEVRDEHGRILGRLLVSHSVQPQGLHDS